MPGSAIDAVFAAVDAKRETPNGYVEAQQRRKRVVFLAALRAGLVCIPCKRVFRTKLEADVHRQCCGRTGRKGRYTMKATTTTPCPRCGREVRYPKKHERFCKG